MANVNISPDFSLLRDYLQNCNELTKVVFKLGKFQVDGEFKSDVGLHTFSEILEKLNSSLVMEGTCKEEIRYIEDGDITLFYGKDGKVYSRKEKKICDIDQSVPGYTNDLRISVSLEDPAKVSRRKIPDKKAIVKDKTSYFYKMWSYDAIKVMYPNGDIEFLFELEFIYNKLEDNKGLLKDMNFIDYLIQSGFAKTMDMNSEQRYY